MPRQILPVQVNQFVGGLNTESNPLNNPENTSADESNMEINRDGSRFRRSGFDVETDYVNVNTSVGVDTSQPVGRSQFLWDNPGGDNNKQLIVVQIGNYLGIHDMDADIISDSLIYSETFPIGTYTATFSYAVVDGILVVATGNKNINLFLYDEGTVTRETDILRIRDLFGVNGQGNGLQLTDIDNLQVRPADLTFRHLYNLRNQTWALPRGQWLVDTTDLADPVEDFYTQAGVYPANADQVNLHLQANPSRSDPYIERFAAPNAEAEKPGTVRAPQGYFIIDALERGASRQEREEALREQNPQLVHEVQNLREDRTPGGPSVVTQYAGRVWYAGFSSNVVDGDDQSPLLGSYVMFSQVVKSRSQIGRCYQKADPTSPIDADLVDDDGGFLKIDGAYNIRAMIPFQSSLFVFAQNGVWRISGLDGDSFRATSPSVFRISEYGCVARGSVVEEGGRIFYWSDSGIFAIGQNEVGSWVSQDITQDTIKTFYEEIPVYDRQTAIGYYETNTNSIRWVYGTQAHFETDTKELIFNLKYGAFTKNLILSGGLVKGVLSISGGQKLSTVNSPIVTVLGEDVTVDEALVTASSGERQRDAVSSFYCILLDTPANLRYTFGGYQSGTILDWNTFGGVDSPAYLLTNAQTGGDPRLLKDTPYVTTFFDREDETYGDVDSSCLISTRWGWTSAIDAGKWSTPRQAYRVTRNVNGQEIISTRNRIRGWGKSFAIYFQSEEGKAMNLYGWSHNLQATEKE